MFTKKFLNIDKESEFFILCGKLFHNTVLEYTVPTVPGSSCCLTKIINNKHTCMSYTKTLLVILILSAGNIKK